MIKKLVILLSIIFFSCNNTKPKNRETTNDFINFDKYTFNTIDGTEEKISLTKGKKYILDFWYLECAPCVKQHKEIRKYENKFAENNIEVIGFSIDRNKERWKNYLKKHQYNWKNYNQSYVENDLKYDLDIKLFPKYYIIDANGNVLNSYQSFKKVIQHFKLDEKA